MKKAFTLIELIVSVVILVILVAMVTCSIKSCSTGESDYTFQELLMPEETKARYQREMVEELRRSNELRELELRRNQQAEQTP